MFIDTAKARLKAGKGGNGVSSFRREKFVPLGGPDGGDGGKGGDIVFIADRNVNTLIDFKFQPNIVAKNGANGKGANKTGRSVKPVKVRVPVGTVVKVHPDERLIHDFVQDGESLVVAQGGKGGLGNQHFATSANRTPRKATPGEPGEAFEVSLELKLIAQVGLVGFPNAGKSTFLSVVSHAKPKIASYPFTTLEPSLGVVKQDGHQSSLLIADIPGLIEGAHDNRGLGIQFLRHIERTKVLLFIIDMSGLEGRNPIEDFDVLRKELKFYDSNLLKKEYFIAANKMDIPDSKKNLDQFLEKNHSVGDKVFPISSVAKSGLKPMLEALGQGVVKQNA